MFRRYRIGPQLPSRRSDARQCKESSPDVREISSKTKGFHQSNQRDMKLNVCETKCDMKPCKCALQGCVEAGLGFGFGFRKPGFPRKCWLTDRLRLSSIQKQLLASASASLNAVFVEFGFGFGFVFFVAGFGFGFGFSELFIWLPRFDKHFDKNFIPDVRPTVV